MKFMIVSLVFMSELVFAGVAPAGSYRLDPDHTNIGFEVSHLGISLVVGRFNRFEGQIQHQPGGNSKLSVDIDPSSVDTKVAQRDNHLRSADFFDVAQFPKAHFESTKIEYDGEGNPDKISGLLTLHGKTNEVVLSVTPVGAGNGPAGDFRAGFVGRTTLKRSAFGMNSLLAVAGDEVTLILNVEAILQ